jgi:hypothetical protein
MNIAKFNAEELCSRKLWQLVDRELNPGINDNELSEAIAELAKRRNCLEQLQEIGKLSEPYKG